MQPPASLRWVGPYQLRERLGVGGMGEVYAGYDRRLERRVALKKIRPEVATDTGARQRFLLEAKAAARLNHPALVQVYDLVASGDDLWIVMELVEGQTLEDRLKETGPFDFAEVLPLALDLADGLAAAHAAGVVHRDLKTENVILTPTARAKIFDFGVAKQLWHGDSEASLSLPGRAVGTPRAMSPEQVLGWQVDPRSDLFSLGILLYETLSDTSPFLAQDRSQTLKRICRHSQTPLRELCPGVHPELSRLIDHLLEKDRLHRPQSAVEVVRTLEGIRAQPDHQATPAHPAPPAATASDAHSTIASATTTGVAVGPPHDERRQVTVLCCDLVDPGDPDESPHRLSPEALSQAISEVTGLAGDKRFGGHVGSVLEHRLLVYFGYPKAREDAARQAVQAALELVSQVLHGEGKALGGLALRLGVHTGPVVVRAGASQCERPVLGQTLDRATRLPRLAAPNCVVVSPNTHRLIKRFFTTESLSPLALPGAVEPVVGHRVLGPRPRLAVTGTRMPLVGRDGELELLHNRWQLARQGMGQVVLVSGEAGIGKSRLIQALEERLGVGQASSAPRWLTAHAAPYAQSSPFHAAIELLRQALGLEAELGPPEALAQIEEWLRRHGLSPPEMAPLLASLLSLPLQGRYPAPAMTPGKQREKTLEALLALVLEMAERDPLVAVVEDLQWADPSTLELLHLLMDHSKAAPFLLLGTFRHPFGAPWGDTAQSHYTRLSLHRLTDPQVETLIQEVLQSQSLPDPVRRQIVARSDGVPLFVEELTRTVLESGPAAQNPETHGQGPRPAAVPLTLRDSLAARLDRLGSAKNLAQLASVLGHEFSHDLVAAVTPLDETTLEHELRRLVRAEVLYRKGFSSQPRYLFKHALLRDAAYESLLDGRRQEYHGHVARVLAERFPKSAEELPEILARHYTEAQLFEDAIESWRRAGVRAHRHSAYLEARGHLERGLALLDSMPSGPQREQHELALWMALGGTLGETLGGASPKTQQAFSRALGICKRRGETREHFWASHGIWAFHVYRGNLHKALDLAQSMMRLTQGDSDRRRSKAASYALGFTLLPMGEFKASLDSLGMGTAHRGVEETPPPPNDPVSHMMSLTVAASNLWFLGYPKQAFRCSEQAIALARQAQGLVDLFPLFYGMVLAYNCRRPVFERAEELVGLAQEYGLARWELPGRIFLAWAQLMEDDDLDSDLGLENLRQRIADWLASGQRLGHPQWLIMLAEACIRRRRLEPAEQSLKEALKVIRASGTRSCEAEVYRLRGEIDLARQVPNESQRQDNEGRAESALKQALVVARRQEAKSLELRTAMGLSRLWWGQGKREEARKLVSDICGWFTEGLDTLDLQEARAFLGDPSAPPSAARAPSTTMRPCGD